MTFPFQITEHIIDGQYIREYPRATSTPDAPLKLCIKQYIPIDNTDPKEGDITIVATHGTGFPKELYEPLWEELLDCSNKDGTRIRSIWIADATNQGASGILNEKNLGNDPSSYDHSRDLIHMINHFRIQMPQPIMGIGHSLGAIQLLFASLMHPRLFTSLILIEPHMTDNPLAGDGPQFVAISTKKRDVWHSRDAATKQYRKILRSWDPRVFNLWKEYGYRELPTNVPLKDVENGSFPVTLSTSKSQESMMYTRPNVNRHTQLGISQNYAYTDPLSREIGPKHDPLLVPDMLGPLLPDQRSYRPEPVLAHKLVPYVRPSVLYISGSDSALCKGGEHANVARRTGTGFGGSGGMQSDRVKHTVILQTGHTLPQEKVADTAQTISPWINQEAQRWKRDQLRIQESWENLPLSDRSGFPPEWKEVIRSLPLPKRQAKI